MELKEEVGALRFPFSRARKHTFSLDLSKSDFSRLEQISKGRGWTVGEAIKQCLMSGLREKETGQDIDTSAPASSDKLSGKRLDDLRKDHAMLSSQENQLNGTNGGLHKVHEEQIYNNTLLVLSLTGNKASIRDYHKLLETEGDGELDEEDRYFMKAYLKGKTS